MTHYLKGGLYKAKGFFAPHITKAELITMLPDYEVEGHRDGARGARARGVVNLEQQAMRVMNQVIEVAEKEVIVGAWARRHA